MRVLALAGFAYGGNLPFDIPYTLLLRLLFYAVYNLASLIGGIGHMARTRVISAIATLDLLKQFLNPLLNLGISRGCELLGIATPFYTAARCARANDPSIYKSLASSISPRSTRIMTNRENITLM